MHVGIFYQYSMKIYLTITNKKGRRSGFDLLLESWITLLEGFEEIQHACAVFKFDIQLTLAHSSPKWLSQPYIDMHG
jgi:hypothetical protein